VRGSALAVLLGSLAAGCGGDEANLDDFIGLWTASGTVVTRCGMGAGNDSNLAETITITKGVAAPLLVVVGDCSLQMSAKDKVASVIPGQKCTIMRNGLTATATYDAGSFSAMGIKAAFDLTASFNLGEGALVLACTYTATGTATKVPK
jgi:hypothetical protein